MEPPAAEQPPSVEPGAREPEPVETADRLLDRDEEDEVRHGCYAKVYTLSLRAGQTYTFDLTSPGGQEWFDPYLRVEDAKGKTLAEDNDSGGRMNARLTFRPGQDGEYRVVVTSFRPKATGVFFLKVR